MSRSGIVGPQLPFQFLPGDDLPWTLQQRHQHLEGLLLQLDARTVLAQFAREVNSKTPNRRMPGESGINALIMRPRSPSLQM